MSMDDPKKIAEMYVKNDKLSTRINIHKFSTNKYGWYNWVFDQYKLDENIIVLEIGCGNGGLWIAKEKEISNKMNIILTDISPLMIEKTKEKLNGNNIFSFQVMDIQNIPFEDENFDIIIANHMLYHVPNLVKALSEVKRVLKSDGYFYSTTIGKNHLKELQNVYKNYEDQVKFNYSYECSFLLDYGESILKNYFRRIEQKRYIDFLEVTDVNAIMDYIVSYNEVPKEIMDEIYQKVKKEIEEKGMFKIEKDSGIFICKK